MSAGAVAERSRDVKAQRLALFTRGFAHFTEGSYAEAEIEIQRAIDISEETLGREHLEIAAGLHHLAVLYRAQSRYQEAEPLFKRAIAIREKALGPNQPSIAECLNSLAMLYDEQDASRRRNSCMSVSLPYVKAHMASTTQTQLLR